MTAADAIDRTTAIGAALVAHRPALLRHCYRMLGAYADAEDLVQDVLASAWTARDTYAGAVPIEHWLMRIATNACLNELARRRRRGFPSLEGPPSPGLAALEERDAADWITPAPDAQLFAAPAQALEARESVALAFLALLQRVPPRQRAALLLKDVVGWSAEDVASALDMTVSAVNSALHRARETLGPLAPDAARATTAPASDRDRDVLRAYLRAWEAHDLDALVATLRADLVFAMPPHATWFAGRDELARFLAGPVFAPRWARGFRLVETHANGQPALAFYHRAGDAYLPSSLQVLRIADGAIVEIAAFLGAHHHRGFAVPAQL